ncbi:glycosyl hydrolase 108 family protein [Tardibacter chloracetimidivorans]|nr:glycosyl hydrolase 108 family protein [Tardibacter chloracetimidivorans]
METAYARRNKDEQEAGAVYERSTIGGKAAYWLGALGTASTDPLSYVPIGGGVTKAATLTGKILGTAAREAAINAGVTLALEPLTQIDAKERGQDRGAGDVAVDMGVAAAFGGLLGAGEAGLTIALSRPKQGRAAVDGLVEAIGPDRLTPDEKAAVQVVTRELDIKEASPFVQTPAGDAAHGARLTTAINALEMDRPVPDFKTPSAAPDFDDIASFVIDDLEGGETRVVDSGGVTRYGISKNANPDVDVENLTRAEALQIYKNRYWQPLGLDRLDGRSATVLFDTAVNHGVGKAKILWERAGRSVEGLIELRRKEYARLSAKPEYAKYTKGWENRLEALEARIDAEPAIRADIIKTADGFSVTPESAGEPVSIPVVQESAFGPVHSDLAGNWTAAVERLKTDQIGEVPAALSHPEIGPIDLVWGEAGTNKSDGFGLAKLTKFHPEVVENLPEIIAGMTVQSESANRIRLESPTHEAAVRLDWDNQQKTWLLTAYEKGKRAGARLEKMTPPLAPDDGLGAKVGQEGSPVREGEPIITESAPEAKADQTITQRDTTEVANIDAEVKSLSGYSEVSSPEARAQTDSVEHDLLGFTDRDGNLAFQIGEEGPLKTLDDVLREAEAEQAAIDAARRCL